MSTLAGLLLSNGGLIPCEHQAYAVVNRALLPLSIPLLLFSADLQRIVRLLGPLLLAFLLGSAATVVGAARPRPPRRARSPPGLSDLIRTWPARPQARWSPTSCSRWRPWAATAGRHAPAHAASEVLRHRMHLPLRSWAPHGRARA